jgi:hypothetical protein
MPWALSLHLSSAGSVIELSGVRVETEVYIVSIPRTSKSE